MAVDAVTARSSRRRASRRHGERRCGGGRPTRQAGNREAGRRERLIEQYLPLAEQLARRYTHTSEPVEDLVQVARVGLVKAVDRWDPDRGAAFSSFAVPTITGELRRYFRDCTWTIKPPRHLQELSLGVGRVREYLCQELGREPSASEIAGRLGCTVEDVLDALQVGDAYSPASLDVPLHGDEADEPRVDAVVDRRADFSQSDHRLMLEELSASLSEREREVLRLRFVEDLLQREIAERIGCSQMHVSRILRAGLQRLVAAAASSNAPSHRVHR